MALSEWERCKPWIAAALKYAGGTHTLSDLELGIEIGRFHLIPLNHSAMIVEIIEYPRVRALHIFLAGGVLEELKAFVDTRLQDIARDNRCQRITIAGRKGFSRALRDIGFKEKWTVLSRSVE